MTRLARPSFAILLASLVLAGCASPESRIKADPSSFSSASEQQQALIRKGEIAIGFKPEYVKLALGEPDRITERTDASGVEQTWHYTETSSAYIARPGYYDPYFGPLYPGPYIAPGLVPAVTAIAPSIETDRLRVVFRDGAVSAIDRVLK